MQSNLHLFCHTALLTIFVIGDGDGDDVTSSDHGATPVVTKWRTKMHLELLLRLKNRVIVDMNCAVFHLEYQQTGKSKSPDGSTQRSKLGIFNLSRFGSKFHLLSFKESDA